MQNIEFNTTIYKHKNGTGYMFEITSKLLAEKLNKSVFERFILEKINNKLFLIKPCIDGIKPYNDGKRVRFYLKNRKFTNTNGIMACIYPKDFNLSYRDFGVIDSKEKQRLLDETPSIWIKGYIRKHSKGMNLSFSGAQYFKNLYSLVLVKSPNKILIRSCKKNSEIQRSKNNLLRKLSYAKSTRVIVSMSELSKNTIKNPNVAIFEQDWKKFDISTFFVYKEEKELAKELYRNNHILYTQMKGEFDIGIVDKECNFLSVIEITAQKPQGKWKCGRYSSSGSRITSKIQSARLWSIENNKPSFVIIQNMWKEYNWVNELKSKASENKAYVIFSDFKKGWERTVYRKINSFL